MQVKRLANGYLIRLDSGENVLDRLTQFANVYRIGFGAIRAIGTFARVTLGYYDADAQTYRNQAVEEPVEVLNLSGNISKAENGQRMVHAHVVVGRSDYSALGGHLVDAIVGPTVEVIVETAPTTVRRRHDPDTGLQLWDLGAMETFAA